MKLLKPALKKINGINIKVHDIGMPPKFLLEKNIFEQLTFKSQFKFDDGIYEGQVLIDTKVPYGYGIYMNFQDGSIYEGYRKNGLRSGLGRLIIPKLVNGKTIHISILEGEWHKNRARGHGQIEFSNGDAYIGNFEDDQMQDKGQLYKDKEGELYIGKFKQGKRDGHTLVIT